MTLSQILRLLFSAAVWGASHVFVRITAPEIGPTLTAFARIFVAALTLSVFLRFRKIQVNLALNLKHFAVIGVLNTALPLFLFAYASMKLPASYLVILNATMPVFNAIFSSVFLADPFTLRKFFGIALGMSGIVLLESYGSIDPAGDGFWLAMVAGLTASACYGGCAVYIKKCVTNTPPLLLTAGSNWIGFLLLAPFSLWSYQHHGDFTWTQHSWQLVLMAIMMLGIFGSGIAFVVYYGLIAEVGAFRSSVTAFMMPVFGIIWGWLFLSERITPGMLGGVAMILIATSLFLKRPR